MFSLRLSPGRSVAFAVFSLTFGLALPARAQFETRATNPFPPGSYSIATGDFNHDGKLDVVMTTNNGFSVALGNGDGTLQPAVLYTTQPSYSLAVADFNGDGKLDIVTADDTLNPSTVSVYLGKGDGTFNTTPIVSNTTSYNTFVVVGDFNGDGKPDIAVIDNPYVSVLLGNGDGTFQPPSDTFLVGAKWLAVGDFNNDHKLDVISVTHFGSTSTMDLLLGNGDGTLQAPITTALQYVPGAVGAGYLSKSANLDAIVGSYLGGIVVFLGNGDGTFQPPVYYPTTGIDGGEMMVADLNLDGNVDVAVPSGKGATQVVGVDVFWGNGDGTLQQPHLYVSSVSGLAALGDLNGDHLPDFAFGTYYDGVGTMLNTGVVSFAPTTPLSFPAQLINTNSAPQSVTLTNAGVAALPISSIKASGPFKISNTCGGSLAAGAKCKISAVFEPKIAGSASGVIKIVDGASSKPQFVELLGVATVLEVSPTSLNFGDQKVGTASAPQLVTATNKGSAALQFGKDYIGGANAKDFSWSDTCSYSTLQPGASCTAKLTFDPTATGARSATFNFVLEGTPSPAPVALSGTGT